MARGASGRSWRAQPNDRGHVGGGVIDSVAAGRGEGGGDAGHGSSTMAPPVGVQYMTAGIGAHHGGDRRGSTESDVQMGSPSPHTPPPLPTPPPPRPLLRRPVAVNTTAAVPGGGDSLRGGHPRRLPRLPSPGRRPPAAGPPAVRLWRQGRRPWPSAGGDRGGSPWPTPSPPSAVLCLSARTQPETGGGGGGGRKWAPPRGAATPRCGLVSPSACLGVPLVVLFFFGSPPRRCGLASRAVARPSARRGCRCCLAASAAAAPSRQPQRLDEAVVVTAGGRPSRQSGWALRSGGGGAVAPSPACAIAVRAIARRGRRPGVACRPSRV